MRELRLNGVLGVTGFALACALLASCGGGGGGGGGGAGGSVLQMMGAPVFGALNGTTVSTANFNLTAPAPATHVAPIVFAAPAVGDRHFVAIQFSTNVLASTINPGTFTGAEGVVIQDSAGNNVRYFLDATGAIDPTNTFPSPGVTPSLVRLYINDATLFGAMTPNTMAAGSYTLNVVTTIVRGATGQPLCLAGNNTSNCANNVEVSYGFSVGPDTTPIAGAPSGASIPLTGSTLVRNGEIRIFFSDNVDFQSLVGRNNSPTPNFTTRDQFISRPYPFNNGVGAVGGTTFGENIILNYNAPAGTVLPVNYGWVLYMPDPFHNPREVRIRVIDQTLAQFSDVFPNTQNYGLPAQVYQSVGQTAPTNTAGASFTLPPILPLPGTTAQGTASVTLTLLSAGSALGPSDTSTSVPPDGVNGVTDRSRQALGADLTVNLILQAGPAIANNPSPPDLSIVVNGNQLTGVSSGTSTLFGLPIALGDVLLGTLNTVANGLNDPNVLGQTLDLEFGRFINVASGVNFLHNAPRRAVFTLPITDNNGDEAIPVPIGGVPENSLGQIAGITMASPQPPIGVRLYAVDSSTNSVKILDSNTFNVLGSLTGIGSPAGLGIAPDLAFLYISNFDSGTVTRVGSNPLQTTTFHMNINTIQVGSNPTAISVTPNNEDVIVINRGSNSMSFIDVASQQQRIELAVGLGPREVVVTGRMNCMGCTLAYQAYVTNFFSNSVSVYESDSVSPMVNNGLNGKIFTSIAGFMGPLYACWNRVSATAQGAYIANSTGNTVQQIVLTNFGLSPPPGFPGVPEFRTFTITQSFSTNQLVGSPSDCSIENMTALQFGTVTDNKTVADVAFGGTPQLLIVTYPAAGQVAAFDIATTTFFGSVPAPGNALYTYYDQ